MKTDRRKHRRIPLKGVRATLICERGFMAGTLINASADGLFMSAEGRGLEGSMVRIRLMNAEGAIEVTGTVVRNDLEKGFAVRLHDSHHPGPAVPGTTSTPITISLT